MSKKYWCTSDNTSYEEHDWAEWSKSPVYEHHFVSGCKQCPAIRVACIESQELLDAGKYYD